MKTKIYVKELVKGCMPSINRKGDWIDLRSAERVNINSLSPNKDQVLYIPLGVAIKLPAGYEAIVAPRSSTPKKFGVICPNSIGIIDNCYNGNGDQWHFVALPVKDVRINTFDRICQFRIQLSQKATVWQKIKHLFSNGIELVKVDNLEGEDRGGFGSTGVK